MAIWLKSQVMYWQNSAGILVGMQHWGERARRLSSTCLRLGLGGKDLIIGGKGGV
jgi:hypothetical protein